MLKLRNRGSRPGFDLLGPESMQILPNRLRLGQSWCQSFAVTGYPREVGPGWLTPLLTYNGPVDVALHVEPIPNLVAAGNLRKQMARLESTRRIDSSKARLADPEIDIAASDAAELADTLAKGEGRLFKIAIYLSVRAPSEEALEAEVRRVRALASSLLLDTRPLTFRSFEGFISTLPIGFDAIGFRRTFDTRALAACFPFVNPSLGDERGILLGRNLATGGLVFHDRFALDNHNQIVLAESGRGKSYLAKLQILRSLFTGVEVIVVDPENEYERLAKPLGGKIIRLGPDGSRINPLDLSRGGNAEAVAEQALFVHTLVDTLLGGISQEDKAILDEAILGAYEAVGITSDPRTHACAPPLLDDVVARLAADEQGVSLVRGLRKYTQGSYRSLFDQPTTVKPEGYLVVFSLKDLPEELKAAGTLLALEAVWKTVTRGDPKPRIVVVDEAWLLLRQGGGLGASFLQRLAKSARKNWCGLTTLTQDIGDVLSSDLGRAVITNASTQILLGQNTSAIGDVADAFGLSEGERGFLVSCPVGQGLVCLGTERVAVQFISSRAEHDLATSKPSEIAELGRAR